MKEQTPPHDDGLSDILVCSFFSPSLPRFLFFISFFLFFSLFCRMMMSEKFKKCSKVK